MIVDYLLESHHVNFVDSISRVEAHVKLAQMHQYVHLASLLPIIIREQNSVYHALVIVIHVLMLETVRVVWEDMYK